MIGVIILAAGNGKRFGGYKQFEEVAGKQIIDYTIDIYKDVTDKLILVYPPKYKHSQYPYVIGGKTRFESIVAGYPEVEECKKILVVDGVRCNTSKRIVEELIKALDKYDVAGPVFSSVNTQCSLIGGRFTDIMDKNHTFEIQTPTACHSQILRKLIKECDPDEGFSILYMALKHWYKNIGFVQGDPDNIKVTYKKDFDYFRMIKTYGLYEAPAVDLGGKDACV